MACSGDEVLLRVLTRWGIEAACAAEVEILTCVRMTNLLFELRVKRIKTVILMEIP